MSFRLILACLLFGSAAMAQGTIYVPQFASGGSGALTIKTTITVVNLGTEVLSPGRVNIETFDENGNPANLLKQVTLGGTQAVSALQREIPGRGTAVVESYSADGVLLTGWAKLTTEDNVAVEVIFSIFAGQSGLVTTTSILPRAALSSATLIVNVDSAFNLVSNLAALNPDSNTESAQIDVDVYDKFGAWVGAASLDLAPGVRIARSWTELIPALIGENGFVGTAEITTSVPLNLLPLRQDNVQLTAQDALAAR